MYYFYENEVYIFRQEINVDKYEIEQLKKQIIKNCSRITHMEYDSDYANALWCAFTETLERELNYE